MPTIVTLLQDPSPVEKQLADRLTAAEGRVYLLDLTGELPADPWQSWVNEPTATLMLDAGERVRQQDVGPVVVVLRTDPKAIGLAAGYRNAAFEAVRGTVGAIALERASQRALVNTVEVDATVGDDLVRTVDHLLDPRYNGFTTGATIHLTASTDRAPGRTAGSVVITGAAGTIGFATAQAFQKAGYEPVLVDMSAERLEQRAAELGVTRAHVVDVTRPEQLEHLVASGAVDDAVAVASVHGFQGSWELTDLTLETVTNSQDINGTSVDSLVRLFTPILAKNQGTFVLVSSQCGIRAEPVTAAYCSPKFGMVGLARGLAPTLAEQGVSIHTLCPGPVDTPFLRAYFERFAVSEGGDVDSIVAERSASMPLGRFARPAEMAESLRFLAQLDATGVLLAPTGGETLT